MFVYDIWDILAAATVVGVGVLTVMYGALVATSDLWRNWKRK